LPLLCRTSRQCRCVYSGRQQAECVRRSRKRPCKSAVAFADQALTPGQTSGKRLPILKPPGESPFSTASVKNGSGGPEVRLPLYPRERTSHTTDAMSEKCRFCCKSQLREASKHDSVLLTRIAARSIHDGPSEE
jgi:hypothetical protein